jgi:hypothetical protein
MLAAVENPPASRRQIRSYRDLVIFLLGGGDEERLLSRPFGLETLRAARSAPADTPK